MNLEDLQESHRAAESSSKATHDDRLRDARKQLTELEGLLGEIKDTLSMYSAPVPLYEQFPFTPKLVRSTGGLFRKPKPPEFTLELTSATDRRCWLLKTSDLTYNDRPSAAILAVSETCELYRVRLMLNVGDSFGNEVLRSGLHASSIGTSHHLVEECLPNERGDELEQWVPLLTNWKPPRDPMRRERSLLYAFGSFIAEAAADLPVPRNAFAIGDPIDLTVVTIATGPEVAFVESGMSPSSWLDFVHATPESVAQSLVKLTVDLTS